MRIAAVTENHEKLSSHFGMAPYYRVFTVEDGKVFSEEKRSKPFHDHQEQHSHNHLGFHGHADMFAPIQDCQVLLCGGMGGPAYQKALAAGLEVVLTGGEIEPALQAYLNGEITSDMRRIHHH